MDDRYFFPPLLHELLIYQHQRERENKKRKKEKGNSMYLPRTKLNDSCATAFLMFLGLTSYQPNMNKSR